MNNKAQSFLGVMIMILIVILIILLFTREPKNEWSSPEWECAESHINPVSVIVNKTYNDEHIIRLVNDSYVVEYCVMIINFDNPNETSLCMEKDRFSKGMVLNYYRDNLNAFKLNVQVLEVHNETICDKQVYVRRRI